jgi:hypothetical protein
MGGGRGLELGLLRICALVLSHSQRLLDSISRLWREQSMTTLSERNCRCGWNEPMEKNDRVSQQCGNNGFVLCKD